LEYFLSTKQLNQRQAKWLEFLLAFNFDIQYQPGLFNGRANALSKRVDLMEGHNEGHNLFFAW
jgi:hypothetical protein